MQDFSWEEKLVAAHCSEVGSLQ